MTRFWKTCIDKTFFIIMYPLFCFFVLLCILSICVMFAVKMNRLVQAYSDNYPFIHVAHTHTHLFIFILFFTNPNTMPQMCGQHFFPTITKNTTGATFRPFNTRQAINPPTDGDGHAC